MEKWWNLSKSQVQEEAEEEQQRQQFSDSKDRETYSRRDFRENRSYNFGAKYLVSKKFADFTQIGTKLPCGYS